jgi:muramoyltetrapeptide carboxypeptidase
MEIRTPPRLRPGDCLGIIAPASPVDDPSRIERGVRYLEGLGYRTLPGKHLTSRSGYLAGTDDERASDIHAMFSDPRVKGIFCLRGGYGTPRLLGLLNYRLIARHPKVFVGYSDITALHLAFYARAGLVSFHGPMVGVDMIAGMDPFAEEALWGLLTSPARRRRLFPPESGVTTLKGGKGRGRLLGGNLSLLVSLLGTPYFPPRGKHLLFLEDVGEEPYRVDRMLAQLRNAGILRASAGVAYGYFSGCTPKDPGAPTLALPDILREYARASGGPVIGEAPFGHEKRMVTLPVGIRAELDTKTGSLELLAPAVA